ncbi:MAG: type II toxin-antitoxin system death-on-curing family toxin [Alphaproteobacteria bacterium]|nr:type II toxin-antitoxin system death-on-curing family toxin [Alphaproteobacteria bacterium]
MSEPAWISDRAAAAINERLVALFGGLEGGVRDENLFQAALARPLNKWFYEETRPDLCALAAAYCFGIVKGHVFLDGNKRAGHAIAAVFLENNGMIHEPPEPDVVTMMVALASGSLSETELAQWFRETSHPV